MNANSKEVLRHFISSAILHCECQSTGELAHSEKRGRLLILWGFRDADCQSGHLEAFRGVMLQTHL